MGGVGLTEFGRDPLWHAPDVGGGTGAAGLHLLVLVPDGPDVCGCGAHHLLRLCGGDGRFALDALIRYTGASVVQVFFITAAAFGSLSLWGYTTNRSLSGMGSFLIMGLVGLILASIVNIFVASSALQFGISVIGVLIFAGLTAYDTQKLKEMYLYGNFDSETAAKASVFGALTLYLDFINMFQFLLALVGNRNE